MRRGLASMALWPNATWRGVGAIAGCLALLAACVEGYPDGDVPFVHPQDMSTAQRLEVMNEIGKDASPRGRWRYRLESGCTLHATQRSAHQSLQVSLNGAEFESGRDDALERFVVRVASNSPGHQGGTVVLDTRHWTDAVQMKSMLDWLRLDCQRAHQSAAQEM